MRINELQITGNPKGKRIGRGGKRGTYSGRGIKGQKSRAGRRILPAERELIQRLPKLRGYSNRAIKKDVVVLNVSDLENLKLDKINIEILKEMGIIKKSAKPNVKILGQGDISTKVEVSGIPVSKTAIDKIKAAGGQVIA